VRSASAATWRDDPLLGGPDPQALPVTRHFRRAIDQGKFWHAASFIRSIEAVSDTLSWQYGYETMPKGLAGKYAYAEFAGPNGPVLTDRVILGIVLFAPNCVYPSHAHDGISESYVCLSGSMSENNQGVFAPGSLIFNPPGQRHRITVSVREPCLLAYAWEGAPDKLAGQKMVFTRGRARPE
jgi:dimethylpropiothetin dethiomethylase